MKKLFSFFAIISIIFVSNCSEIPENNDPIIGIWTNLTFVKAATDSNQSQTLRQEWIFNDVFLGRYHGYNNNVLEVQTDFKWSIKDGLYTISYPGTDISENIVTMEKTDSDIVLQENNGVILATRE